MLVAINEHGQIMSTGTKLYWRDETATLLCPERKGNRRSDGRLFVRWHDGTTEVLSAFMFNVRVIDIGSIHCTTPVCERHAERILADRPVCLPCFVFQTRLAGALA